jgi:hypothetical protein
VPKEATPIGRIAYSSLITPRLNENNGKNEYSLGFVLKEEDCEEIFAKIEKVLEETRQRDPRFPKDNSKLNMPYKPSMTKDEQTGEKVPVEGELLFNFKRNATRTLRTGEVVRNDPPMIYDSTGRLVDPNSIGRIGSGTTGKAVYEFYVYNMAAAKGVQMQLVGFQISELKRPEEIQLAPIEGGWVAEESEADEIAGLLADA